MSIFKRNTWGISKALIDINNYSDWINTIKKEKRNPKSKFNYWKLSHNPFYTLYFTLDIAEEENQLPENIKRLRILESLAPLNRYLDEELGFAECLVPELNQFIDSNNNPTLTYLIAYRFAFNKLSLRWVIKWIVIIILLTILISHFNLFSIIFGWISTLI
jgi:hypothetical protein